MKLMSLVAVAAGFAFAAPAAAITAFATFSAVGNASNVSFTGTGNGAGTLSSMSQPVTFRFLNPDGSNSFTDFAAIFNLNAVTSGGVVAGGTGIAPVTTGTFSFTSATPVTFGGLTGNNLLSGSFEGGAITALIGGSTATYGNSTPPNVVTFTSDFLDFSTSTARDLAFAIGSINPLIEAASLNGGIADFSGTIVGTFGSDSFDGSGLPVVPEPATWALMISGFGLVGTAMRRRNSLTRVTA